jgi:hypothetical protein
MTASLSDVLDQKSINKRTLIDTFRRSLYFTSNRMLILRDGGECPFEEQKTRVEKMNIEGFLYGERG